MDLKGLTHLAIEAAHSAGFIIQQYMNDDIEVQTKSGGSSYASQVVTVVDHACETAILSHLLPTCHEFDIALLTEESADDGSRFTKDFFWCVDPMDGTLAFIEKRAGFSVSIALVARDGTPYIGVVYDPTTKTCYCATKGQGAFKNGSPWKIKRKNTFLSYVSERKLRDSPGATETMELLQSMMEKLRLHGLREITGAGAVMNAILVLEHGPACMLKLPKKQPGGGSIWDFAATACIYQELGLPATNYAGGRLDLNSKDGTFMHQQGVLYSNF